MIRKLTIALAAIAAVGVTALAPTSAEAGPGWKGHGHHKHGHHRWHRGYGFYGPAFLAGGYCYTVRRVVPTRHGPRLRRVTVCH